MELLKSLLHTISLREIHVWFDFVSSILLIALLMCLINVLHRWVKMNKSAGQTKKKKKKKHDKLHKQQLSSHCLLPNTLNDFLSILVNVCDLSGG